jgi:diguanylate cyclase (GGDEF)-like protein/PAS domain S-box-containing protein
LTTELFGPLSGMFKNGHSRREFARHLVYVSGATLAYVLFAYWLYAYLGNLVFFAVVFPILLAGLLFGTSGGVIYSLLALAFNLLLAFVLGASHKLFANQFIIYLQVFLFILLGLATGWVRDLRRSWRLIEFRFLEHEQISQTILDRSPVGITVRDRAGELLFYNPAWLQIWGMDVGRAVECEARTRQLSLEHRYPYLAGYTAAVCEIFQNGGELFIPAVSARRHDDGKAIWLSKFFYALQDAQGAVDRVVVMTQDVTQHIETQEILKESEKRYRGIFDNANDGFLILYQGRVVDCNQRALDLFGTTRERFLGLALCDFSPCHQPDGTLSEEKVNEMFAAALAGEPQCFEWLYQRVDGETFMAEVGLNRLDFPSGPHILAALRDITERKRSEQVQAAIYRISEAANSPIGLQDLFTTIHAILNGLMAAENMFIALYDSEKDLITFPYFVDQFDPTPEPRRPSAGLTEFVLRTQQPQLVSPERFDYLVEQGEVTNIGTPSVDWLGVPLKVEGHVIGVLGTQTYQPGVRFGKEENDIVNFVSDQVAMAVYRKRGEERLRYLSIHDPLTGLYNRVYFEDELAHLERGRKFPVSVLIGDLDGLKKINDQFGHAAGDEALCQAARILQRAFRAEDGLARIGGDEFAVLLPGVGQTGAAEIAERVRQLLAEHNRGLSDSKFSRPELNISLGVATFYDPGIPAYDGAQKLDSLYKAVHLADERMYQDKQLHKQVGQYAIPSD